MTKLRFGIVVFPGSNCDHDALTVCQSLPNAEAKLLWHKQADLEDSDVIILPGGFSFGDYLRAGAIARFSPIMQEVIRHAKMGKPVLGICNGFQILCEAGLLPAHCCEISIGVLCAKWSHSKCCEPIPFLQANITKAKFCESRLHTERAITLHRPNCSMKWRTMDKSSSSIVMQKVKSLTPPTQTAPCATLLALRTKKKCLGHDAAS